MPAFVFADLAGFTALTEAHGDADASLLAERFAACVAEALVPDAKLVKMMGDAAMIVAVDVDRAFETAQRLAALIDAVPGRPALRAGIHAGDAVQRDGDYFGHAVNLAARAAAFARPCEFILTADARDGLAPGTRGELRDLGPQRLRNIVQPVRLYAFDVQHGFVTDPVCRMRITEREAHASHVHAGATYYFCAPGCAAAFTRDPAPYLD